MYHVFKRKVWKKNASWHDGFEPCHGRKTTVKHVENETAARAICREANNAKPEQGTTAYYNFVWTEYESA